MVGGRDEVESSGRSKPVASVDRARTQRTGLVVPSLRQHGQALPGAAGHRGDASARISSGHRVHAGSDPARLCAGVCDSAHVRPGRGPPDGLLGRRGRDARPRGVAALHACALSDVRRRGPVGRTASAGRPSARVPAGGEGIMSHVTSKDGTTIAYDRSGSGPALILVDGALCSRGFGPTAKLAPLFAGGSAGGHSFTVYRYDRRGRGESGDTQPYTLAREIDDLAALIERAGGRASLLGLSSGGALALHATAAGLSIEKVVAYEPPYVNEAGGGDGADHEAQLQRLLASGDRGGAVSYFMRDMVGAPAFVPIMMRLMPWIWRKLKAVAPTLSYDAAAMTGFRVPRERFVAVDRPVLVLNGTKT